VPVEFIDGHPVCAHQVRFRLRATVDEADAPLIRDGAIMVWLVRTHCQPPAYLPLSRDADERCKLAVQDVEAVVPLTGALRSDALDYIAGGGNQSTLPFESARDDTGELGELRHLLAEVGELRDGERVVDAVQRLFFVPVTDTEPQRPEPQRPAEPSPPAERAAVVSIPSPTDVEVVGSIYRGRRSDLSDLLAKEFE
jgi:hypothetical protein